jgi:alkanesulfonate monooxygenase SsuD/methylene tetrahydromethanopterin reductase-like flavin-dependent oxidoreductase (luciferase family)
LIQAINAYRSHFGPSTQLDRPYVAAAVNVICAQTDAEARRLFTSVQQAFTNRFRGKYGRLPTPIDDIEAFWTPTEKEQVSALLTYSFVGAPESVRVGLQQFIERTGVDEVIVASAIYDHSARVRSYELLSECDMLKRDNDTD